jgi:anti-anti-sigma factor
VPTPPHPRPSRPTAGLPDGDHPAADTSLSVSASVAGFDGVAIATITRFHEPVDGDHGADDALAVVAVSGDVDADTAPLLRMALTEAINSRPRVRCELHAAEFFGAAGANTLLTAHQHATAAGCHFTVQGVHGLAGWVLAVTGLDGVLILQE